MNTRSANDREQTVVAVIYKWAYSVSRPANTRLFLYFNRINILRSDIRQKYILYTESN